MTCVIEIEEKTFGACMALSELEFDKLGIIGDLHLPGVNL